MGPQEESLSNKILSTTLVILIVVAIGVGGYVFWSTSQNKSSSNVTPTPVSTDKKSTITPTEMVSNDPNDVNIGSVEADLKDIEVDVKNLQ